MLRYLVRRILVMIPVILGVTIVSYFIITLAPGNPVDLLINPTMSEADKLAKAEALGLNKPIIVQYWNWLLQLFHGNLGYSFATYTPVTERIFERMGPTLLLTGTAVIGAYLLAIPIGVISGVRQYSLVDYATVTGSLLGISLPSFFVGLIAIYVFALVLRWLPTGGMMDIARGGGWPDVLKHLIMPACVLSFAVLGNAVRYVRSSMIEVINQDYIRTARAKGLADRAVIFRHALRNALIPVITVAGLQIPLLLGGAVITEQIFQWPGMGLLTIEAINARDYPTLMGLNLMAAFLVLAGNLLADIAYAWTDPRIRYD